MIYADYYNYEEVKAQAMKFDSTAEERLELYFWFERFDSNSWNGECFPLENGKALYPVYKETFDEDGEVIEVELIDARIGY